MADESKAIDYVMEASSAPHFSGRRLNSLAAAAASPTPTPTPSSYPVRDFPTHKQPFVIGVSGGTASGKTTVCDMIIQQLHDHRVVLVNQDSFYRGLTPAELKRVHEYNFDHPDAFDTEQLLECAGKLKSGQSVHIPIYDFKTHRSQSYNLCLLSFPLRWLIIDADADVRLARRIRRDTVERYAKFVKPAFDDFILPSKKYADVVIPRGGDNHVAIDLIVQHIRTKLGQHDLCKIYPNVYVIQSTFQMAVTTYNTSLPASERYNKGKVQVALVWNSRNESSPSFEKLNALANYMWIRGGPKREVHLIHSIWANFQTSTNNVIFGNRWRHLLGERDFWEHVGGIDVSMAPSSFGQANTRAFDSLLHKLHKYVPYGASVVDLYAGAGVIGLSLAATRKCRSVKCVEVNKEAKFSFEKTVSRLPTITNCSISWHQADTSKEPLSWLMGSDVVVVDPPRKGLDSSLLTALQSLSSIKIKHNLRERIACPCSVVKQWHLDKAHGYNFFPGTQSVEVLAVFKRGSGVNIKRKKSGKKKRITCGAFGIHRCGVL
ncbi:Uridine kinase-like protein 1, chloroplastic [Sesamum angolense]|uniref:uridine/cytidine kinase n=1 Tax=Sesamum angolense TaxID=2727404 RepID=A0AAE2C617_9LAMI|nr:Uridine kinase-like protein 1, chloroplastic [Sesamum angolense]